MKYQIYAANTAISTTILNHLKNVGFTGADWSKTDKEMFPYINIYPKNNNVGGDFSLDKEGTLIDFNDFFNLFGNPVIHLVDTKTGKQVLIQKSLDGTKITIGEFSFDFVEFKKTLDGLV